MAAFSIVAFINMLYYCAIIAYKLLHNGALIKHQSYATACLCQYAINTFKFINTDAKPNYTPAVTQTGCKTFHH